MHNQHTPVDIDTPWLCIFHGKNETFNILFVTKDRMFLVSFFVTLWKLQIQRFSRFEFTSE